MLKKVVFLILALMTLVVLRVPAAHQPFFYYQWQRLSDDKLLAMGRRYSNVLEAPDSALACYTIVANRHDMRSSAVERGNSARGYMGKWYVYFFSFFDYYKAYESLCHAEELARGLDREEVRVLLNFGCMYQTLAEQTKDAKTLRQAYDYYRRCFHLAMKTHDGTADIAFANLTTVSSDLGKLKDIRKEWNQYRRLPLSAGNDLRSFNHQFYIGRQLMEAGRYDEASRHFANVIRQTDESLHRVRYRCVAFIYEADAQSALHDYASASASLHEALSLSKRNNLKDAMLEIYDKLAVCYARMGAKENSMAFRSQYLQLKDTLLNYQQLMKVNEMRFVNSMKKVDEQMQQVRHRQQVERIVSLSVLAIALISVFFLWVVWHKNRSLRRQNVRLYERTVEMIKAEEEEQKRRKSLEEELNSYRQQDSQRKEKYQYSSLDEADKVRLKEKILSVMESSPEIYSADFTAEQLARMVGSKYKYVSQVINETYGRNFSSFLNEYRIKEACRRIGDREHYGNLTTEAIAHGVGFKSRTTFIASFKKVTGLTPSEYIRISLRH